MADNMTGTPGDASGRNYYDELFDRLSVRSSTPLAVESVAEAYLDGKPQVLRKKRTTRRERDRLFWSSRPVIECPSESWERSSAVGPNGRHGQAEHRRDLGRRQAALRAVLDDHPLPVG